MELKFNYHTIGFDFSCTSEQKKNSISLWLRTFLWLLLLGVTSISMISCMSKKKATKREKKKNASFNSCISPIVLAIRTIWYAEKKAWSVNINTQTETASCIYLQQFFFRCIWFTYNVINEHIIYAFNLQFISRTNNFSRLLSMHLFICTKHDVTFALYRIMKWWFL